MAAETRRPGTKGFQRSSLLAIGALLALLASGGQAVAHQKWLWPNVFRAEKAPVWISFDVTWSDHAFTAEQGVGEQPLAIISPKGERLTPGKTFVGNTKSTAEIELTQPGTYRLESVDPLTYWTRVEADGQERWIKKPKDEVAGAKITRSDLYYSQAVAFVTASEPSALPPPDEKDPLDIVPKTHPARLTAGGPLELEVLSYGKPVAKAKLKIFGPTATGHEPSRVIECDEAGVGKAQCDEPGRHLIACELERAVTDDPKADLHSFNVYLTLFIQPKTE